MANIMQEIFFTLIFRILGLYHVIVIECNKNKESNNTMFFIPGSSKVPQRLMRSYTFTITQK